MLVKRDIFGSALDFRLWDNFGFSKMQLVYVNCNILFTVCFQSSRIPQKGFLACDNVFQVFFMRRLQTNARNGKRVQPDWRDWLSYYFNFYNIFAVPSSSRHKNIFKQWKNFRNIPCPLKMLNSEQMTMLLQKINFPIVHTGANCLSGRC